MLTQILYLITSCLDVPTVACVSGAALVHYGFLSTFCWTWTLSFDICRSLTARKLSSSRENVPLIYGTFSCGLPLLVVALALAVDLAVPGTVLSPGYGRLVCWIGTFWGLVVYFLVPVATLLLCCLVFYLVFYVSQTSLVQNAVSGVRNRQRAHAVLFVRLALVMGSPWAIAFAGTFVESVVLDCVVNVLVGLQGVCLFLAFKDYRYFWSSIRKRARLAHPSNASSPFPTDNSLLIIPERFMSAHYTERYL
ncbi:putative G-protein coupled receptor Mth-like 1 [Dermacentor variabilis]|uniref:putative G-protein coupled receptor Mth-like 1 n=1 Tax=Dermacentor variabilis TaxID=34621 RepID=UPI003F5BC311